MIRGKTARSTQGNAGRLNDGKPLTGRFLQTPFVAEERNYSDRTAEAFDEKVHKLIDECYCRSQEIPLGRHTQLASIAKELIQKETLDRTPLDELIRTNEQSVAAKREG